MKIKDSNIDKETGMLKLEKIVFVSTRNSASFFPRKRPQECQWSDQHSHKTNDLVFGLLELYSEDSQ